METLIKALQIFLRYGNPEWPTCCEHDVLYVDIDPSIVSLEDIEELDKLGFMVGDDHEQWDGGFYSYKFGSC